MADTRPIIYGPDGQPIRRDLLTREIAGPSTLGLRSPFGNYPADGLTPVRLANILREADHGHPMRYFELAEQVEERDPHYVGILGTRKRCVSQLPVQVIAADDTPDAKADAEMVEQWLTRDELQDEIFHILDAIGKGVSFTEIVWDSSEGQWEPKRLVHRDPRSFEFSQIDGDTPLLRGGFDSVVHEFTASWGGEPLPMFKFISAAIGAKSGLAIRSGLARLATWSWMFKAFTLRDWAIFTQTFGQPVRVGKYPAGTQEVDKETLFRAVADIAGDCAAIIPESMMIEFIQAPNIGASHALYRERADWLDQQMSKAVLGQTATTDAIAGGHAVGQEHRKVQEDIERADAKALSVIINRDLIQPWTILNRGPQKKYARLKIGREDDEDIGELTDNVVKLVPFGLEVEKSWMNDKLGIPLPAKGAALLTAPAQPSPYPSAPFAFQSLHAARPAARMTSDTIAALTDEAERLCAPGTDALIDEVRAVVERCTSLQQVQAELMQLKPLLAEKNLAGLMRMARVVANLTGRADLSDA